MTNPLGLGFDAQAMIGIKTNGPVELVADEVATWRESSYVVIAAGLFATLLWYPGSSLAQAVPDGILRRALMGLAMGLTAIAIIYSP